MKTTTTITIDSELRYKAKVLNINISQLVNMALKNILNQYNEDNNLTEIEEKLDEINNQLMDLKIKKVDLISQKTAIEEKNRIEEEEGLKEQLKEGEFLKRTGILESGL